MKSDINKPMYLTAGNFPSIAANTIQVAKMASAYTEIFKNLLVVALTGPFSLYNEKKYSIKSLYGLSIDLNLRFLPFLFSQRDFLFDQDYRPPKWFYHISPLYAKVLGSDLIFTRKPETAITAIKLGLPTILETHDPMNPFHDNVKIKKILNNDKMLSIVVVAESIAESLIKFGITEKKIIVEPDGVDLSQYKNYDKEEIRGKLNLPQNKFICAYTGHLYRDRGIEVLLDAALNLPEIFFLIVGGWEKDVKYYTEYANMKQINNIIFTGFVKNSQIPFYQTAADVLIMQYSSKTYHSNRCSPLKIFEYLASGSPIIATDLPVLKKILKHKENSILVTSDSVNDLVNAIGLLHKNPEFSKKISSNAKKDSLKYSWNDRAKRIINKSIV